MTRFFPRMAALLSSVSCAALLGACDRASGGTTDETSTVTFYLPDGAPAAGARVQIYASSDTTRKPRDQVFADQQGRVRLPRLEADYYNLVTRDESGRAIFQDSLVSDGKHMDFASDTLVETGVVVGRVRVQPQHSPRIVWIALLGSGTYLNVDDSGRFRIEGVAEGRYTVAGFTKTEGYTTTYGALRVKRDSVSDIGTLDMVFTGLPVVRNLEARFDTLAGVVHLRWDSVGLRETWKYTVLRDGIPVGVTTGARWIDTVSDEYPADVPSEGRHLYRVVVSDLEGFGPPWETIEMRIISATLYEDVKVDWARKAALPWRGGVFSVDTLDGALVAWRSAEFGEMVEGPSADESRPVWSCGRIELWRSLDSGVSWVRELDSQPLAALPVRFGAKWWSIAAGSGKLDTFPSVGGQPPISNAWTRFFDTVAVVSSADGRRWDTVSMLIPESSVADIRIERDASRLWVVGANQTQVYGTIVWQDLFHWFSDAQGLEWRSSGLVGWGGESRAPFHSQGAVGTPVYNWQWWSGRWWSASNIWGPYPVWSGHGLGNQKIFGNVSGWNSLQRFCGPTAVELSPGKSLAFLEGGAAWSIDSSGGLVHVLSWPGGGFHRELLWGGRILSISDSGVYLGRILSGLEGGDPRGTWVKKTETPRVF